MNLISVKTDEYKELLKTQARVEFFADYVNKQKHIILREDCANILGFELENEDDRDGESDTN